MDGPVGGYEGFVVGTDDDGDVVGDGEANEVVGSTHARERDGVVVAQGLAGDPILAVGTVEVTAEHAKGEGVAPGIGVPEGFLFDGVDLESGDVAPGDAEFAGAVETDSAHAGFAVADEAAVATGEATDGIAGFVDHELGGGRNGVVVE